MNTLLWVAVGLVAYTLLALLLRSRGYLPSAVRLTGPLATVHTRRGREFLDRLARPRRLWRAWANVGLGVTLVVMFASFLLLVVQGLAILRSPPQPTQVNQPRNFLVIPGVNDFLPLSVAPEILFGLLVGLVVHEGGHGLLCRVEGIEIESMGLVFLTLLPVGAFVAPDEESQRAVSRGARTRMFAAGVTNNFAVTILAFALLFGPVIAAIGLAPGVAVGGVYAGSPADTAGIGPGDRVTAVAGTPTDTDADLDRALRAADGRTVAVEIDGERTVPVERSLVAVRSVPGSPTGLEIGPDDEPVGIRSVNGTPVDTRADLTAALADRPVVRLETANGTATVPAGAFVTVAPDGPLAAAGAPSNASLIVTAIDGERVTDDATLRAALDGTEPGQRVSVRASPTDGGPARSYDVALGAAPDDDGGFLGVGVFPGVSGLVVTDLGVQRYPAGTYLELLGGDGGPGATPPVDTGSPLSLVGVALVLPLASAVLGIPNFPGFTGVATNFYVVEGPLAAVGAGGVFLLANALFWTAWINLQLGLFNCIPGYPLDGGRILRTTAESVVARLPVAEPYRLVRTITTGVGLTMLASLVLLVFGAQLLN
jgi:membrane-associated protease RseP (regulator of RpoE activity)